jgi:hypothetical protein
VPVTEGILITVWSDFRVSLNMLEWREVAEAPLVVPAWMR